MDFTQPSARPMILYNFFNDRPPIQQDQEPSSSSYKRKATSDDRPKNKKLVFPEGQVSTELRLAPPDPFVIKRTLEDEDVSNYADWLRLPREGMKRHVLPYWDEATKDKLMRAKPVGVAVKVWDLDQGREHHMKLHHLWADPVGFPEFFGLCGGWNSEIVRKRRLKKGDQVGLCWDQWDSRFVFSVLHQQQQPLQPTLI